MSGHKGAQLLPAQLLPEQRLRMEGNRWPLPPDTRDFIITQKWLHCRPETDPKFTPLMSGLLSLQCLTLLPLGEHWQGKHQENLPSNSSLAQCQSAKPQEDPQECAIAVTNISKSFIRNELSDATAGPSFHSLLFLKKQQSPNNPHKTTSSAGT